MENDGGMEESLLEPWCSSSSGQTNPAGVGLESKGGQRVTGNQWLLR